MDGINVKSLEERSEGDVASPSSTGTQVQYLSYSNVCCFPFHTFTFKFFTLHVICRKSLSVKFYYEVESKQHLPLVNITRALCSVYGLLLCGYSWRRTFTISTVDDLTC